MFFENFLQSDLQKHQAILLVSKQFINCGLMDDDLCKFAKKTCCIQMSTSKDFYHPDLLIIDRERNQLRLEDVQKIKDFCLYPPQLGNKRLIFIENCERLNLSSANFILKSLEEPAAQVMFLFTTAHKHLLLPTILSRVQTFYVHFQLLAKKKFTETFEKEAVDFISKTFAHLSTGGLNPQSSHTTQVFFGNSLSDPKNFRVEPQILFDLITNCEKMSKKYSAEELRGLVVYGISERLKKDRTFAIIARFMMAHIRAWKRAEPLNPSSQLWLLRILLGQTYENTGHS